MKRPRRVSVFKKSGISLKMTRRRIRIRTLIQFVVFNEQMGGNLSVTEDKSKKVRRCDNAFGKSHTLIRKISV